MRRRFVLTAIAIVAFLIVVSVILIANLKKENSQEGYGERGEKSFPLVSFVCGQKNTNPVYGYASKEDAIASVRTVLPNSDGDVFITFSDGDSISKVQVILENEERTRLLDERDVNLINKSSGVTSEYTVSVMAERGQYYYLTVAVHTTDSKTGYYTTRLYMTTDEDIEDKDKLFALADSFSTATIQKREDGLTPYLDYKAEKAGTDLSYVNLHSSKSLIMWAGLSPKIREKYISIYDWSDDQISMSIFYNAISTVENETNEYYVREDFCLRERGDKLFILNYERYARQKFDGRRDEIGNTSILLGIQDNNNLEAVNGQTNDDIFFIVGGALWHYRGKDNVLTNVYGTSEGNYLYDYNYDLHFIGMISNKIYFSFLGYVETGEKEGENAFALYEYDPENRGVVVKLYVTLDGSFDTVKDNNARIVHISQDKLFTVDLCGSIYSLDLSGNDVICLVSDVDENSIHLDAYNEQASWKTKKDANSVSVMNLETGKIQMISNDERGLDNFGFIGRDIVYGILYGAESDKQGFSTKVLYDSIHIVDEELNEKVNYEKSNKIYAPEILDGNLTFKLTKYDNGQWVDAGNDSLTFAGIEKKEEKKLIRVTSSEKKRNYYYLNMPGNRDKTIAYSMKLAEYRMTPASVTAGDSKVVRMYIATAYGRELYRGDNIQTAIQLAYDNFGTVYHNTGNAIWNRRPRELYLTIKLPKMKWTEEGHEDEMAAMSSLERGIDIFVHSGVLAEVISESVAENYERKNAANIYEELSYVYGDRLLVFEKCNIPDFLYYINMRHPVLVIADEKTSYLITGYTTTNLVYYNPEDRSSTTVTQEEAAEFFGDMDARYVTYY